MGRPGGTSRRVWLVLLVTSLCLQQTSAVGLTHPAVENLSATAISTSTIVVTWDLPNSKQPIAENATFVVSYGTTDDDPEEPMPFEACVVPQPGQRCEFTATYPPGSSLYVVVTTTPADPAMHYDRKFSFVLTNLKPEVPSNVGIIKMSRNFIELEYDKSGVFDAYVFGIVEQSADQTQAETDVLEIGQYIWSHRMDDMQFGKEDDGSGAGSGAGSGSGAGLDSGSGSGMGAPLPPTPARDPSFLDLFVKSASSSDERVLFAELTSDTEYTLVAVALAGDAFSEFDSWTLSTDEQKPVVSVVRTVTSQVPLSFKPDVSAARRKREASAKEIAWGNFVNASCDALRAANYNVTKCDPTYPCPGECLNVEIQLVTTVTVQFTGEEALLSDSAQLAKFGEEAQGKIADTVAQEINQVLSTCNDCGTVTVDFADPVILDIVDPCTLVTCTAPSFCENGECRCLRGRLPPRCTSCLPGNFRKTYEPETGGTCKAVPVVRRFDDNFPSRTLGPVPVDIITSPVTVFPTDALLIPPALEITGDRARPTPTGRRTDSSVEMAFINPFGDNADLFAVFMTTNPDDVTQDSKTARRKGSKQSWLAMAPCAFFFSDPESCGIQGGSKNGKTNFNVGGGQPCAPDAPYCNGPLDAGIYYVALRGIGGDGAFRDAPFSSPQLMGTAEERAEISRQTGISDKSKPVANKDTTAIVFLVIALLLGIIGVAVVLFIIIKVYDRNSSSVGSNRVRPEPIRPLSSRHLEHPSLTSAASRGSGSVRSPTVTPRASMRTKYTQSSVQALA